MKTVAERAHEALLRCVSKPLWLEAYQPEIERAIREAIEDCALIADQEMSSAYGSAFISWHDAAKTIAENIRRLHGSEV